MSVPPPHPSLLPPLVARRGEAFGNFIAGAWLPADRGELFDRHNPADPHELVGRFPRSGPEAVAMAAEAAHKAFPAWRDTPAPDRGLVIARAQAVLARRAEELAQALTWEVGKPLAESRQEVGRALAYLAYVAGMGRRLGGQTLPSDSGGLNYVVRRPLGVVGLVTPWNFPVNIPLIKSAPALVAGNTVVLKPSEHAPLTAALIAEVYAEAGVPEGAFNVVFGEGAAGAALVAHPLVRAISFTGSTATGRAINMRAAERFCRVQLEMGGKNASIILEDADLERAARDVATGAFSVTGQRCNANSLVLVAEGVFDRFAAALVEQARQIRVGPGLDAGTGMGPLVTAGALAKVQGYVEAARADGATILTGGEAIAGEGHFFPPTVITGVAPTHAVACEEIFGPVAALVPVRDLEAALAMANALPYGLASSVYTRDLASAMAYAGRVETGVVHVNCPTTLSEPQMPYGGMKESGFGYREMGDYVLDFCTDWQAVYLRP